MSLIEGRFHALICERNQTDKAALELKGFVFPRIACLDECTCSVDNDTLLVCPRPGCGCDEKDDRGVFLCQTPPFSCSGAKASPYCGVDGDYPVPGMYGGFYNTCLGKDESSGGSWYLTCESWCRVAGGSGQRHRITAEATVLTEDGFC